VSPDPPRDPRPASPRPRLARRNPPTPTDSALAELRAFGLAYPGAHTKSPWPGHLDLAVNDKTFAYLSINGEPFRISCKLPSSGLAALLLPFAKPTAYGLGRSGWVSAELAIGERPPVELFKAWIDESYRAQAPRRLVASLLPAGEALAAAPMAGSAGRSRVRRSRGAWSYPSGRAPLTTTMSVRDAGVRDAGAVLGISQQRVQQLVKTSGFSKVRRRAGARDQRL
jgi:predicted DNA-binding protein (MmcQ/YjbR family)